jgi:two-component sensor histidine kinase
MEYSKSKSAKFFTEINGAEQEIEISWTQQNEGQGIDVVIDDNGGAFRQRSVGACFIPPLLKVPQVGNSVVNNLVHCFNFTIGNIENSFIEPIFVSDGLINGILT